MGEVYRVMFPNGKSYVGITATTVERRMKSHLYDMRRGSGLPFHRALRRYPGPTTEVLATSDDWETLCRFERRAIAAHRTFGDGGYNLTPGGDGAPKGHRYRVGLKHTPEARAKMSRSQMGRKQSAETRAKIGAASLGNKHCVGLKHSRAAVARRAASLISNPVSRRATSGAKGVSWCKQTKRWRAHITTGGKMRTLGRFSDLRDAVAARKAATPEALREVLA